MLTIIQGKDFTAFSCSNIEEEAWERWGEFQYELAIAERLRDLEPLHDPNRFRIRVNKSGRVRNLGMKVNQIPSTVRRI